MKLRRRSFLAGAAAVGAGGVSLGGSATATAATHAVGGFDVVALVDASGPFFRPRDEVLLGATAADWEHARHVDPGAFGEDGRWRLDFRCFAIRRPDGRVTLIDAGVGPRAAPLPVGRRYRVDCLSDSPRLGSARRTWTSLCSPTCTVTTSAGRCSRTALPCSRTLGT